MNDAKHVALNSLKYKKYDFVDDKHKENVFHDFKQYYINKRFTDITVIVEENNISCHRLILAANSSYFRAVFNYSNDEQIHLPGITVKSFLLLLEFMYTSSISLDINNAIEVLEAADFLQMRDIVEACSSLLLQAINVSNCVQLMQVGECHMCISLAEYAQKFATENFNEVVKSEDFIELSFHSLLSFLQRDTLFIGDEYEFLVSLEKWIKHFISESNEVIDENIHLIDEVAVQLIKCINMQRSQMQIPTNLSVKLLSVIKENKRKRTIVIIPRSFKLNDSSNNIGILYFNSFENKWCELVKFPFDERFSYAIANAENKLCLSGGLMRDVIFDEFWSLDIDTVKWVRRADMLKVRVNHCSIGHREKLYVFGGLNVDRQNIMFNNDGEEYDFHNNQWSYLITVPDIPSIGRASVACTGNYIYLVGGMTSSLSQQQSKDRQSRNFSRHDDNLSSLSLIENKFAWRFDTEKGIWVNCTTLTNLLQCGTVSCLSPCFTIDGFLLFVSDSGKPMHIYDPLRDELYAFHMSNAMHSSGGHMLQGYELYSVGGIDVRAKKAHDLVHFCNLLSNQLHWEMFSPLTKAISQPYCVTLYMKNNCSVC